MIKVEMKLSCITCRTLLTGIIGLDYESCRDVEQQSYVTLLAMWLLIMVTNGG